MGSCNKSEDWVDKIVCGNNSVDVKEKGEPVASEVIIIIKIQNNIRVESH